ncbi:MAG: DUF4256 domain-containing protein [Brevefilum sp.]|nr:DUF4256 domain-containing protein [Brevefilum sp.]
MRNNFAFLIDERYDSCMKQDKNSPNKLTTEQAESLLSTLQSRFEANIDRHPDLKWAEVQSRLESHPNKLWSLSEMARTGGEPDVVGYDEAADAYLFYDCSTQSPEGRRSLCYDQEALESRKKNKPEGSAMSMAEAMGIAMLTEAEYRHLQSLGEFDTTTSSWLITPSKVRTLGGAIFGDRRYDTVWVYHNGADSYYGARGFRGSLRV